MRILVGVALGRGVIEAVGDWVLVGICVVVSVLLGKIVFVDVRAGVVEKLQPASHQQTSNNTENNLTFLL
ncbi:MAG: hypothetical protein A2029_01055 [Chloroflexi bacterium RBG_19FT_COMBO_47_9]|nr:MAG: hypothetical protein A2029_01055 [Chloroflexi bacterium RBG_19FT_COMBO_47_9]